MTLLIRSTRGRFGKILLLRHAGHAAVMVDATLRDGKFDPGRTGGACCFFAGSIRPMGAAVNTR